MNRKEAIDTLNAIQALMKIYPKRKKQKEAVTQFSEAIDMAIKSLNNWTDYSDKLWKIAYERGKADALEWIPCDEKLPSESGEYLVSYVLLNDEIGTDIAHYGKPLLPLNTNETEIGWYKTDGDGDYYIDDILAWQPLPKPYCPQNDTDIGTTEPTVSHEEAWAEPSDLISRADLLRELTIDAYGMFDAEDGIVLAVPLDIITHEIVNAPSVSAEQTNALKETETKEHDDLISRKALINALDSWDLYDEWGNSTYLKDIIDNVPSVSAERVIRCKDCEYFKKIAENCENLKPWWATECVSAERSGGGIRATTIILSNENTNREEVL